MAVRKKFVEKIGASEGIRTLDIHLGKVTLYQTELRSLPKAGERLGKGDLFASPVFAPEESWQM
jgi:hypothetical protein